MILGASSVICAFPLLENLATDYTDKHGWLPKASFTIRTNPSYPWSVSQIKPVASDGLLQRAVPLL